MGEIGQTNSREADLPDPLVGDLTEDLSDRVDEAEPNTIRSLLRSTSLGPTPFTLAKSSKLLKGPFSCRQATICWAFFSPTPDKADDNWAASALLIFTVWLAKTGCINNQHKQILNKNTAFLFLLYALSANIAKIGNFLGKDAMDITQLLTFSVQQKASDLHISAGLPPMLRIDGDVRKINAPELDASQAQALLYDVMNDLQRKEFETNLECDFSFNSPGVARFRANVFRQERGIGGVFRTIPSSVLSLDELQAPAIFADIADTPRGLVLVTGPTGSGKSTTLAAMIDYINERHYAHILTVEDPIEFVHSSKNSLINQREVHRDTRSFSNALRAALREDPDVILVGEMRDLETIKLALTAAETGHLVFGTLHTSSAAKTIDRIIDVFPGNEKTLVRSMLSESLRAVISQTLIKRKQGGRVAAHEIMLGNAAIRNLIREDKVPQMYSIIQTSNQLGMQTLDQSLQRLVDQGIVTRSEAAYKASNKEQFVS